MSNFYTKMGSFFCCCSEPATLVGYDETATMYHSINRKEKNQNGYDATKDTEQSNLKDDLTDDPNGNDTEIDEPKPPKAAVRKASQADLRKTIVNVRSGGASGEEGPYKIAKEIALSSDGYIAVVEHAHEKVYLYDHDGTYQCTMKSPSNTRETKLLYPTDVTFTPDGEIAVVDQSNFVKIFDKNGQFLSSFNIRGKSEPKGERPKAYSIDVTVDKQIVVGDVRRKVITVHAEKDGTFEWVRKVQLNIEPHFLATTIAEGHQHVLVCDWKAGIVNAIDLEADDDNNVIFQLDDFKVDGHKGLPKGVAYDKNGHFFLAVSRLDDSSTESNSKIPNVYANTGQIHQYSSTGEFENCLYKGLAHPRGIAWSNEYCSLYIANTRSVIILDV